MESSLSCQTTTRCHVVSAFLPNQYSTLSWLPTHAVEWQQEVTDKAKTLYLVSDGGYWPMCCCAWRGRLNIWGGTKVTWHSVFNMVPVMSSAFCATCVPIPFAKHLFMSVFVFIYQTMRHNLIPCSVQVKIEWSLPLLIPYAFMACTFNCILCDY
jgi:hypothetical protein